MIARMLERRKRWFGVHVSSSNDQIGLATLTRRHTHTHTGRRKEEEEEEEKEEAMVVAVVLEVVDMLDIVPTGA
jgi:hypothetical protein